MNVDFNAIDSTSITVIASKDGEAEEYPTLIETGFSSGVFTGTMPTVRSASLGLSSDGPMCLVAGISVQGVYNDVSYPNHTGHICGHDVNGKQISCGPACPQGASCFDPTVASVLTGVYGNLLLSTSPPASVSPSLNMWNISTIFSESAACYCSVRLPNL